MTNLTQDLENVTAVVESVTDMTVSVMEVFMEPPLVIFVGLGIFGTVAGMVRRFLKSRK